MGLADQCCEFWHTLDDQNAYATIEVGDHQENMLVKGAAYKLWLTGRFYHATRSAPSAQLMTDVLNTLAARAIFDGPSRRVYTRLANLGDRIILDLADEGWRSVEVTAEGWRVAEESPVPFRRPRGLLALPEPVRGGSIEELRPFVNVGSDADFRLMVAFLLGALRGSGPYVALAVHGEQGSAKTTTCTALRRLVDPSKALRRAEPHEMRDLMISTSNSFLPIYDNLSNIEPWLSDALCLVLTGGGFSARQLYTDDEEKIFEVERPVVLNGITEVVTRPDLLDRCIVLGLPVIGGSTRRDMTAYEAEFIMAQPRILGALLDGVATALRNFESVELNDLPRMADFAKWITAGEPAFGWEEGTLLADYRANIGTATEVALEDSPVVGPLRKLLDRHDGKWPNSGVVGSADDLLRDLTNQAGGSLAVQKIKGWPGRARDLAGILERLGPVLRRAGIDYEKLPRETSGDRKRPIQLTRRNPVSQ